MWLNSIVRGFREYLTVLVLIVLSVAVQVGCDKNYETTLAIEKPTNVYAIDQLPSAPSTSDSETSETKAELGKVIRVLKPGDTAKAIGVLHGKGYDALQVKLTDGTEGLIIAGDTFTAIAP